MPSKTGHRSIGSNICALQEAVEARKAAGNRLIYNDWVWGHLLNRRGCQENIDFTMKLQQTVWSSACFTKTKKSKLCPQWVPLQDADEVTSCIPPSQTMGLDPGKKNVATMIL